MVLIDVSIPSQPASSSASHRAQRRYYYDDVHDSSTAGPSTRGAPLTSSSTGVASGSRNGVKPARPPKPGQAILGGRDVSTAPDEYARAEETFWKRLDSVFRIGEGDDEPSADEAAMEIQVGEGVRQFVDICQEAYDIYISSNPLSLDYALASLFSCPLFTPPRLSHALRSVFSLVLSPRNTLRSLLVCYEVLLRYADWQGADTGFGHAGNAEGGGGGRREVFRLLRGAGAGAGTGGRKTKEEEGKGRAKLNKERDHARDLIPRLVHLVWAGHYAESVGMMAGSTAMGSGSGSIGESGSRFVSGTTSNATGAIPPPNSAAVALQRDKAVQLRLRERAVRMLYEVCRVRRLMGTDLRSIDSRFVEHLFYLVEETRSHHDEAFNYQLIKLITALNEQFMVNALSNPSASFATPGSVTGPTSGLSTSTTGSTVTATTAGSTPTPKSTNLVLAVLESRLNDSKTFGENLIFMLNRASSKDEEDLCMQLLVLKLLYLLFTRGETAHYFYTNDLKVLVDVFIRELEDLPDESESLRHTYLRVLHPLLTNTQLCTYPYKRPQIRRLLLGMLSHAHLRDVTPTTRRLVERCLRAEWCVELDRLDPDLAKRLGVKLDDELHPPDSKAVLVPVGGGEAEIRNVETEVTEEGLRVISDLTSKEMRGTERAVAVAVTEEEQEERGGEARPCQSADGQTPSASLNENDAMASPISIGSSNREEQSRSDTLPISSNSPRSMSELVQPRSHQHVDVRWPSSALRYESRRATSARSAPVTPPRGASPYDFPSGGHGREATSAKEGECGRDLAASWHVGNVPEVRVGEVSGSGGATMAVGTGIGTGTATTTSSGRIAPPRPPRHRAISQPRSSDIDRPPNTSHSHSSVPRHPYLTTDEDDGRRAHSFSSLLKKEQLANANANEDDASGTFVSVPRQTPSRLAFDSTPRLYALSQHERDASASSEDVARSTLGEMRRNSSSYHSTVPTRTSAMDRVDATPSLSSASSLDERLTKSEILGGRRERERLGVLNQGDPEKGHSLDVSRQGEGHDGAVAGTYVAYPRSSSAHAMLNSHEVTEDDARGEQEAQVASPIALEDSIGKLHLQHAYGQEDSISRSASTTSISCDATSPSTSASPSMSGPPKRRRPPAPPSQTSRIVSATSTSTSSTGYASPRSASSYAYASWQEEENGELHTPVREGDDHLSPTEAGRSGAGRRTPMLGSASAPSLDTRSVSSSSSHYVEGKSNVTDRSATAAGAGASEEEEREEEEEIPMATASTPNTSTSAFSSSSSSYTRRRPPPPPPVPSS